MNPLVSHHLALGLTLAFLVFCALALIGCMVHGSSAVVPPPPVPEGTFLPDGGTRRPTFIAPPPPAVADLIDDYKAARRREPLAIVAPHATPEYVTDVEHASAEAREALRPLSVGRGAVPPDAMAKAKAAVKRLQTVLDQAE